MTVPTPRQFEQAIAQTRARLLARLGELPEAYERAYGASLERVVRESTGKITSGSAADPTATITGDPLDPRRPGIQASIRKTLERAPKRLVEAENVLGAIMRDIDLAMDRLDPRERFDPLRNPISITQAEHEEYLRAKARRQARGEAV